MKARPINYTRAMVLARREGRKRQTRRLAKDCRHPDLGNIYTPGALSWEPQHVIERASPYGVPGDGLWVREAYLVDEWMGHLGQVRLRGRYEADGASFDVLLTPAESELFRQRRRKVGPGTVPGRFMYRSLARDMDEVVRIRVERLQEITEEDAMAEGIEKVTWEDGRVFWRNYLFETAHPRHGAAITDEQHRVRAYASPVRAYQSLWESIHGPGSWALNLWVWVIEFKPEEGLLS